MVDLDSSQLTPILDQVNPEISTAPEPGLQCLYYNKYNSGAAANHGERSRDRFVFGFFIRHAVFRGR